MSIVSTALEVIGSKRKITHKELITSVCEKTGNSYESVRGTLIKSRGGLLKHGFSYHNGVLTKSKQKKIVLDYDCEAKNKNWKLVKDILPPVESFLTLGGEQGNCIKVFEPKTAISYDYSRNVCRALKRRFPWVKTYVGDIFDHSDPVHVANFDTIGYMCGTLFTNLQRAACVGHTYIVLTIQKQVGGFRNAGKWKEEASKKYAKYEDKNEAALKDALQGYTLLLTNLYKRNSGAREMRTTVWRAE